MTDEISQTFQSEKEYGSLKTLTLLTYIGCGIGAIYIMATPFIMSFSEKMLNRAATAGQDLTASQAKKIEDGRRALELAQANLVPLLIIGSIGIIACFIGALWMRKLKKEGYYLYLAGEILPVIAGFILMGTGQFTGVVSMVIGLAIPIVFVILYSVNFKYLK